jgi:acyl-CoA thioester hydrolase
MPNISSIQTHKPKPARPIRVLHAISTRWMDNDAYGHVNNVVYYSWFDTAVNAYLIENGVLDIQSRAHCRSGDGDAVQLFCPAGFSPDRAGGLCELPTRAVSSVRYELAASLAMPNFVQPKAISCMSMWMPKPIAPRRTCRTQNCSGDPLMTLSAIDQAICSSPFHPGLYTHAGCTRGH